MLKSGMRAVIGSALLVLAATAPVSAAPRAQQNPPSWALDRIDQRGNAADQTYHYDSTGEGVTVYVIDTGVDPAVPDLAGRVDPGRNLVDGTDNAADGNGDGTRMADLVAGTEFGVAKAARIVPVKVLDDAGNGRLNNIISGIDWVTRSAKQPAVAVIGFGGPASDGLDDAVRRLIGVMPVVAAAGWSGVDSSFSSPARIPEVLTVGAVDRTDAFAPKSNSGLGVDLLAPGVDVPSAAPGSTAATPFSGTSVAAALTAGAAALYRAQHPDATPAQVVDALINNATPDKLTGVPQGTPNRLLYTLFDGSVPNS
ncbi:S8 family peptidase [Amycolatopsis thermophila]|uniref:S8 family peptidase n=1 Tax=Amycolatopsis thermophila TaxID=206084 RepID=UPI0027D79D9A|nr:S8 family peptidase [Amycolatopsis thermophila]